MTEMAKFPYLTHRNGSQNWYYKRDVAPDLWADGRQKQVWRSLGTPDRKKAEAAYATVHAEIEQLIATWREESGRSSGAKHRACATRTEPLQTVPLTPALLRRLSDAHYLNVYDSDFQWRGDLWRKVHEDEKAFWRGEIIEHPKDDWRQVKGQPRSYYAYLMEEPVLEDVFLYCVFRARKERILRLQKLCQLGDSRGHEAVVDALLKSKEITLPATDRPRLLRKLIEVEIKALEDLTAGDASSFDSIVERHAAGEVVPQPSSVSQQTKVGQPISALIEQYLEDTAREREWPLKTILRKRGELREFLEVVGDKPINRYTQDDGVRFKDIQMDLPTKRQVKPFKGLALADVAKLAHEMRASGNKVELLSPITINDKIGTVSVFFTWAKARDSSVTNPVTGLGIKRRKNKRQGKSRYPWNTDELNQMFMAPIFTGCRSETHWRQPGNVILRQSAVFWVPLIALFSGMRLGEIIQMQVADVKTIDEITYFDVTPLALNDASDEEGEEIEEEKSLKTSSSRRSIPVHQTLFDIGFGEFLKFRRESGTTRLFPEYEKAKDDGSWSKRFSKHFKRFRDSIGVSRRGVKFHSLRHNVEDALRNANERKEIRDAIQGHGEVGVSREYGTGYYVKTLNGAVQKIKYEGLDLKHLIDRR